MPSSNLTYLIVPGLRDHVEAHWQTLLAKELSNSVTVPPLEQDKLSCKARLDAIDRALERVDGPVVIVAHSAGCMMVAHCWQPPPMSKPKCSLPAV
mgnify:CR=1 FL=1